MKLTSPKAFKVAKYVLRNKEFNQLEISKETGVSLGMVNKVIVWMEANKMVEKSGKKYVLVNPINILRAIALSRPFSLAVKKEFFTNVRLTKEQLIEKIKSTGDVLCLGSALENYGEFFRAGEVTFYSDNPQEIDKRIFSQRGGLLKVTCYAPDFDLEEDSVKIGEVRVTSKVQTVIDLFCDNKAYYAKELLKELWGVEV